MDWKSQGRQAWALCCVARSGSSWFSELISSTGVLGRPAEYLLEVWEWFRREGLPAETTLDEYFAHLLRTKRTPNGVFAIKGGLESLGPYFDRFGSVRCVRLRRENQLEQAVSWYRAEAAGSWTHTEGQARSGAPPFDRSAILEYLREIQRRERAWDEFFQERDCSLCELTYEAICHDPLRAVRAVAAHLGMNAEGIVHVSSQLQIVRDETTRRWMQQLRLPGDNSEAVLAKRRNALPEKPPNVKSPLLPAATGNSRLVHLATKETGMYLGDTGPVRIRSRARSYVAYGEAPTSAPVVAKAGIIDYGEPGDRKVGSNGRSETPPLRVAHVGQSMVRAGIEQWLKALVRFSNPERLHFTRCIATSSQVDPEVVAEMGVPVELGQAECVQRAARECDVMMCWGPVELATWLDGVRPGLCVFVAHGESDWTRRLLEGCGPVVDHVIAVSERVRERVCHGFPTTVIPNGVDTAHVAQCRPRDDVRRMLGFGPDDFVIGYVGRFSQEKNPERLLEAIAVLPPCFKALLVGWGNMLPELMEIANELTPGRYAFATADSYLGDYYQAMDALCLVSEMEGFALVVLEAMICERPVIVSSVGCVPEVVKDRVNGIVIPGDAASIAEAAALLKDYPQWARGVAAEGRRYATQYGHAWHMARRYEQLLRDLWARKTGSVSA